MNEFVVLDIETTGVDINRDVIIEIAAVRVKHAKVVDKFQTLINPGDVKLSPTISVLTGIGEEDLKDAPGLAAIRDRLIQFVGSLPIMGHNIDFDLDFLKEKGIDLSGVRLDTLELAYTLLPRLRFYSLEYLAYYYSFADQPSHRAMTDVLATVELYDLLLFSISSIAAQAKERIKKLISKSDWDWSFVFTEDLAPTKTYQSRITEPAPDKMVDDQAAKLIEVKSFKIGFNIFELTPQLPWLPVNLSLASAGPRSVLVVSNEIFRSLDWPSLGLSPHYPTFSVLDSRRLEWLLNKPKLGAGELKLAIKIIIHGQEKFDPAKVYLTKDEFYLFEQKLAPLKSQPQNLAGKTVMSFSGFWELLQQDQSLGNRIIFIPQWLRFDEWVIERHAKTITPAYLNAVVASRRDFIHDFITDHKLADRLFKNINELGSHLVMTTAILGLIWQDQQKNSATVELEENYLNTKNGTRLKGNIQGIIEALLQYRDGIGDVSVGQPAVREKQIAHTNELIEYLNYLVNPPAAHKIYLDGWGGKVMLRIVKQAPGNIWQDKLKKLKLAVVTNGALVDKSSHFISSVFGATEPMTVARVSPQSKSQPQEIIWVRDLPHPRGFNYQKKIFGYLGRLLEKEPGKSLIVLPSAKLVKDFFDEYQPRIKADNFLSYDIAGNLEVLKHKLAKLNAFTIVINAYNLDRAVSAMPALDKVVFARVSFDPPARTYQLMAKGRFLNSFADYSLPKAVIIFRIALAQLFSKTHEFWVLDSKLLTQDYGQTVRNSLLGFREVEADPD